ncbi:MAG: hypothetical protein GY773_01400, partial [Actinomycetia bacterium]|nr:hypothetical protein [Actinomycetes bacterium]
VGLLVLVMLAGCGGNEDPADVGSSAEVSNSTPPDEVAEEAPSSTSDGPIEIGAICGLVADEEISAIVGNPVLGADIDATLCEYAPPTGVPGTDGTAVDLFLNDSFEETCDLEFGLVGAYDEQEVGGLGDSAYWEPVLAQVFVCTGDKFMTVTLYKPSTVTDDEALDQARQVAERALAAL